MIIATVQVVREATLKEIKNYFPDWSNANISRKRQQLRDALNKQKPKIISIDEFLDYYL